MKKYFLSALMSGMLLFVASANAFSPPPPDEEEIQLCESTGGTKDVTSTGGYDPETGIDYAWTTVVNCICPEELTWDPTGGCVNTESIPSVSDNETQKQDNTNLYFVIGALVIISVAILWTLRKK